jgi:hypothetical protein
MVAALSSLSSVTSRHCRVNATKDKHKHTYVCDSAIEEKLLG